MNNKSLFISLILCSLALGCNLETAPNGQSCANMQYVQISKDIKCVDKTWDECQNGACDQYKDCKEFASETNNKSFDEEALKAIHHHLCPNKDLFKCKGSGSENAYCEYQNTEGQISCDGTSINPMNDTNHCGARGNCDSDDEGENWKGRKCAENEKCTNGKCEKLALCGEGTHYANGNCVVDTGDHCGSADKNCEENNTYCENGRCVDECAAGTLECRSENSTITRGICVNPRTSSAFCGAEPGDDGQCINYKKCDLYQTCNDGKCECSSGYHLIQNGENARCEQDTDSACGIPDTNRVIDCTNLENVENARCESGYGCKIIKCANGFHKNLDNSESCVEDDADKCGPQEINCSKFDGWKSGKCVDNSCVAESCQDNYHIHNNNCEIDTWDHCGDYHITCSRAHANATCENGKCKYQCEQGYQPKGDSCVNSATEDCGGKSCSEEIQGWVDGICDNGTCKVTECDMNHYLHGGTCKESNNDNCGFEGNKCGTDPNGSWSCVLKKCELSCNKNYHINANKNGCNPDDTQNCGEDGRSCAKVIPGWLDGTCENKQCHVDQCINLGINSYHLWNDTCEQDTKENCGSHGNICPNIDNATTICSRGNCSFTCNSNFHKTADGTGCEPNTVEDCGSAHIYCKNLIDFNGICTTDGHCDVADSACPEGYEKQTASIGKFSNSTEINVCVKTQHNDCVKPINGSGTIVECAYTLGSSFNEIDVCCNTAADCASFFESKKFLYESDLNKSSTCKAGLALKPID